LYVEPVVGKQVETCQLRHRFYYRSHDS